YVLGEDNTAQRRDVVLGRMADGLRVVQSGLEPTDTVIVNGLQKVFMPGMPVTPTEVAMDAPAEAADSVAVVPEATPLKPSPEGEGYSDPVLPLMRREHGGRPLPWECGGASCDSSRASPGPSGRRSSRSIPRGRPPDRNFTQAARAATAAIAARTHSNGILPLLHRPPDLRRRAVDRDLR